MELENITLTKGQALVLVGPQGCGKTIMSERIAKKHGSFIRIDSCELDHDHALAAAISSEPDTVIVEGLPSNETALVRVKSLITANEVAIRLPGQKPRTVKAPNFIFCSGAADPIPHIDHRRFFVVRMGN